MPTFTVLGDAAMVTPPALDAMYEGMFPDVCPVLDDLMPVPLVRIEGVGEAQVWGCYRLPAHTGRHLGIATVIDKGRDTHHDYWVVWDRADEIERTTP